MIDGVLCGTCGRKLVLRFSKKSKEFFYGCSGFPVCRGTHKCNQKTKVPVGAVKGKTVKTWRGIKYIG